MDIDLEGRTSNDLDQVKQVVESVWVDDPVRDGITFAPESLGVARIKEDAEYVSARVRFF